MGRPCSRGTARAQGKRGGARTLALRQPGRQLGQPILGVVVDAVTSSCQGRQPDRAWLYGKPPYSRPLPLWSRTQHESSGSRIKLDAVNLLKDRLAHPADKDVLISDLLDMLLRDYEERGKKGVYKPVVTSDLCTGEIHPRLSQSLQQSASSSGLCWQGVPCVTPL